jgi:hypothetical protein
MQSLWAATDSDLYVDDDGLASSGEIVTANDRTVHGVSDQWEIVRYDRAGKWYLEAADGRRVRVGVRHAARVAADGTFHPGLPGGQAFDRLVRERRLREQP